MAPPSQNFLSLPSSTLLDGSRVHLALTRAARRRGLRGVASLHPGSALLLLPCRSVHTFGMRLCIDLLWLDRSLRPIALDAGVPPRRFRARARAHAVLETRAGSGERFSALLSHPSVRVDTRPGGH